MKDECVDLTATDYMDYLRDTYKLVPGFNVVSIIERDIPTEFKETVTNQCILEGLLTWP